MDYSEDLQILRDLYYRLSEKSIFFDGKEVEENRKLIEDYIKNYCERYGLLKKYHYLVDHVMLLRAALLQGRLVQTEVFNGTLGLSYEDRNIKDALENWNTEEWNTNDSEKRWVAGWWNKNWSKSTNKERFIQEYGKEYIDEIIKEIEILNNRRKEL